MFIKYYLLFQANGLAAQGKYEGQFSDDKSKQSLFVAQHAY